MISNHVYKDTHLCYYKRMDMYVTAVLQYLREVSDQFQSGHAKEHAYRPALHRLMESFDDVRAVNDPRRSEYGNPDFIFLKKSNQKIIRGYGEAKDVDIDLNKVERTNQMERYGGYANLYLTNYLEFRFFRNGEKYKTVSLGVVKDKLLYKTPEHAEELARELAAFIELPPEKIRSGKRLAEIMGGKARRIRDNGAQYLSDESDSNGELERIYEMMKQLLVHDLTREKFADMYAQTLVYGLFVARYSDSTPQSFDRSEARDLVPKSNPFLRHFFDHIVGPDFDTRLGYIVDELCEVFSVSDVQSIVHKHLRIADTNTDAKDPIIHFYEDFLSEYDPAERKRMGAYYTPIPVVRFMVRQVDKILKEEFGIAGGLSSSETIQYDVETGQDLRHDRRKSATTKQTLTLPRVQVLDPAVGTATFLNETIKFIYEDFKSKGQEGRWPSYVQDTLIKRLHGFELMMAPYTIAHLKLGMTLKETGVDKLNERLGVYLTNTLEEGVSLQGDMFTLFGLAEAVADESRHAAEIKRERPIMVVMGNPPYSGHSSNNTKYANSLVDKYKVEPGGQKRLQERNSKWLSDDYVKFIAFAEDMIEQSGSGIVAMITNNGYLDNPTFRGMRWRLTKTFDKIYVLDLHGNAKKQEKTLDGGKDENVFDIMQGVSIILAVKTNTKAFEHDAELFHGDIFGTRKNKFANLLSEEILWKRTAIDHQFYSYIKDTHLELKQEYIKNVSIADLFMKNTLGFQTHRDNFAISSNTSEIENRIKDMLSSKSDQELLDQYALRDNRDWQITSARKRLVAQTSVRRVASIQKVAYRVFDNQYTYFDEVMSDYPRSLFKNHVSNRDNIVLGVGRQGLAVGNIEWCLVTISEYAMDANIFRRGGVNAFPLYLYHDDGTRTANFDQIQLDALLENLSPYCYVDSEEDLLAPVDDAVITAVDVLDYIYAVLHSPKYRETYKEFLKIAFPRIPKPTDIIEFFRLVELGRQLRELHLMKASGLDNYDTTYPEAGENTVEKLSYDDGKVYINGTQYFGNVPEIAWNFYIGGYQPAQKWLKDRKDRQLSSDDIDHYQKIIKILIETDKIMKEIDSES